MIPLHLRKKLRTEKPKPKHFEVMPPIGSLMPGQRINVQVKFMPTEEVRDCLTILQEFYSVLHSGVDNSVILLLLRIYFFE